MKIVEASIVKVNFTGVDRYFVSGDDVGRILPTFRKIIG